MILIHLLSSQELDEKIDSTFTYLRPRHVATIWAKVLGHTTPGMHQSKSIIMSCK